MEDCRSMSTPMITSRKKLQASEGELVDPTLFHRLIGSLMYLVNTILDMSFVVNNLSQFMVETKRVHQTIVKHILRYLHGTGDYGLYNRRSGGVGLVGFVDSHWAGSALDQKSTSGCCFSLGSIIVSRFQSKAKVYCVEFCRGLVVRLVASNYGFAS